MGRIREAYETKFRVLLRQLGARRSDDGIGWLLNKAQGGAKGQSLSEGQSLEQIYRRLSGQVQVYLDRHFSESDAGSSIVHCFICDAGLGGLARWLRAAGYEAHWTEGITDDDLIKEATRLSCVLLTTDSIMMQRRVLRDGIVPSVWVSPSLKAREQLTHVLMELKLPIREPRCMACGGELLAVEKESVADRIPPRTLLWLDEYFQCVKCGKLFWHGTHWEKIQKQLSRQCAVEKER